jgi:hypothetical protein
VTVDQNGPYQPYPQYFQTSEAVVGSVVDMPKRYAPHPSLLKSPISLAHGALDQIFYGARPVLNMGSPIRGSDRHYNITSESSPTSAGCREEPNTVMGCGSVRRRPPAHRHTRIEFKTV